MTARIRITVTAAVAQFARAGVIVSDDTVRRMAQRGQLDAVQVGKLILIEPSSIDRAASQQPVKPQ